MRIRVSEKMLMRLANYSGMIYTLILTFVLAGVCLLYICPSFAGEGQCTHHYINASILFFEAFINLFFFHYYNFRNQVGYWTVKSSSLLIDDCEQISQFGRALSEEEALEHNTSETQRLIMDDRSSESLRRPPPPLQRLDFRDPILGAEYDENGMIVQPSTPVKQSATKYCNECNMITPRRCHHCPLCQFCVLRKDHHCFITGGCVGLANQRFFIVFLLWACIGTLYGAIYMFLYLDTYVTPAFPFGWLNYVGPVSLFKWIFGYETGLNVGLSFLFCMSFSSGFGAMAFFAFQMFYTLNGYTMHDYHVGRLKHHLESDGENYQQRLALVFGRRWWLNFLFPQFWIPNQMTPAIAKNIFLSISKDL